MVSSSPSSLSRPWKYDVFLSFRGETRNDFTSHLYHALRRNQVKTFIDEKLDKGKALKVLLQAIEESSISIIIFSEDFAASTWCLDEVLKIVECMETLGQRVLPVFLRMDPANVTKDDGIFAVAIAEHEERAMEVKMMQKIPKWKKALQLAASQCGWDSNVTWLDSKLVEEIVKDVLKKLNEISPPSQFKNLVGMNSRLQQTELLLCIGSDDIRSIGIWGMGGIGKTTIAKALFQKFSKQFEATYFLENVNENAKKWGLHHLLKELYSRILHEHAESLDLENNLVKIRLHQTKVLIVLDDVEDSLQLEKLLLGGCDSFCQGSKIIVTSRDIQVFRSVADETYNVEELNGDESLQLFCRYAFKQNEPSLELVQQSAIAISYCNGSPLALKVLGSALFGKGKQDWISAVDGLRTDPNPQIHNVLRTSYDGLSVEEKKIFLDIACFFRGWDRDYVAQVLDGCYSSAYYKISGLIDKSLVTISDEKLEMHDLLQELGWNIVSEESTTEPGSRSRLHKSKDVYDVLRKEKGTQAIEGLSIDVSKMEDLNLKSDIFRGMDNLKLLQVIDPNRTQIQSVYESILTSLLPRCGISCLDELSYLYWHNFPFNSLPSSFNSENLVVLHLPHCQAKRIWRGAKNFPKLRQIRLENSLYLSEVPNLSKAKNIEYVDLSVCERLVEIPSSFRNLKKLQHLDLHGCRNLEHIPSMIDCQLLRVLNLSHCWKLKKCPEISGNLEELYLSWTAIQELPKSIVNLKLLRTIKLDSCSNLTMLPELPLGLEELNLLATPIKELPQTTHRLKSLKTLDVRMCSDLARLPRLPSGIEVLFLSGSAIKELLHSIHELKVLRLLDLTNCLYLTKLPQLPPRIEELYLSGTPMKELPRDICELKILRHLDLTRCLNFTLLPELPISIEELHLSGTAIEELPLSIKFLTRLVQLELCCPQLARLPSSICALKSLRDLHFNGCSKLENFPEIFEPMENLTGLLLDFCKNFSSLPNTIYYLESLETLRIIQAAIRELPSSVEKLHCLKYLILQSCENLIALPVGINKLSNCTQINLDNCKRLSSLPELPPSLKRLSAHNCESLKTLSSSSKCSLALVNFGNCFQLEQNARSLIAVYALWQIQLMKTKVLKDKFHMRLIFPESEIPQWFTCRSPGSSVIMQLPSDLDQHKGIAFCVVLASDVPTIVCSFSKLECYVRENYGDMNDFIFSWDFSVSYLQLDDEIDN